VAGLWPNRGATKRGLPILREGLAAFRETGSEQSRPYFLCLLADACREMDRPDDGLSSLTESLAAADEHEEPFYEAQIYRLKGELLLRRNNSNAEEAQNCFQRAEITRNQSGATPFQ
jgi:hypothetical protein